MNTAASGDRLHEGDAALAEIGRLMLRSLTDVDMYHAWINVYTNSDGWVDGVIYFDGTTWKLMDPTFASSSGSNSQIMQYIGNSGNYTAKYLY